MLAHAFLPSSAPTNTPATPPQTGWSTVLQRIQRLFITLVVQPLHDITHRLGWSDWRRRHQQRSRTSHYQRQATSPT